MTLRSWARIAIAGIALLLALLAPAAIAGAEGLSDDGNAEWRVEQPEAPAPPTGVVNPAGTHIGLGRIGDISFYAPNRGALITAGNGSTIKPGVWIYNGQEWREIATQCGATDGRIVWSGPEEFWTVSDGRPGQASENGIAPPLEDNTLCHFAPGPSGLLEIVASYASLAFESSSYQPMSAAACISSDDCWFAGAPLPVPQIGAFQLHWNGHNVTAEPYLPEGHTVRGLQPFEGRLFESLQLLTSDKFIKAVAPPPALRTINPEGISPLFENVEEPEEQGLLYGEGEHFSYLDALQLGGDENALWAAAGPSASAPASVHVGATILRLSKLSFAEGGGEPVEEPVASWSQVLGPATKPTGYEAFTSETENSEGIKEATPDDVSSIAAEPGTPSAWVALLPETGTSEGAQAKVARISADGTISDKLELPAAVEKAGERFGPLGSAETLVCPAEHDCWLTTADGWLLHLAPAGQQQIAPDTDPVFSSRVPIETRPADEGVLQVAADEGFVEEEASSSVVGGASTGSVIAPVVNQFATVALPLLSHVRSRLVKGTTLELSFHLAVRARVRLLAERKHKIVASTAMRTLKAGNRSLLLRLNAKRWPTKLSLKTHALAPLPTTSTREANVNEVSTSLAFPRTSALLSSGLLP